jgi:hypothetical protein
MTAHSRIHLFAAAAVGIVLFTLGCGQLYQDVAVEKSGLVVVMLPKMASPRIYPDFTQEELRQAETDYAIAMRRDIESVLARRLTVAPDEKVDSWLKTNGLYGQHLDHDDCMNAARKSDGDIVVESYIRLVPEDHDKKRQYDVDVEIRLTDVWNTDTLAVFKWQGTKEEFASNFWALVKDMNVHAPKKK